MDKFEEECPPCLIGEWNSFILWEIQEWTKALFSAIPAAKSIESSNVITDPSMKEAIFDKLGSMNG